MYDFRDKLNFIHFIDWKSKEHSVQVTFKGLLCTKHFSLTLALKPMPLIKYHMYKSQELLKAVYGH